MISVVPGIVRFRQLCWLVASKKIATRKYSHYNVG